MALYKTDDIKRVNFEAIPDEMKNIPQWFMWIARDHNRADGKLAKYPTDINGKAIKWQDKANLYTFDEVKQAYEQAQGKFAGVSFNVAGSNMTIIDLDTTDGSYKDIEAKFLNAGYVETSVSGRGAHVIFKGTPPHSLKDTKNLYDANGDKIELFHSSGYIAITGNTIDNHNRIDTPAITEQFMDYLAENYAPSESHTESHTEQSFNLDSFVPPRLNTADVVSMWLNTHNPKLQGRDVYKKDLWHMADEALEAYNSDRSECLYALINELAYFMWDNPKGLYDLITNNPYWADYLHDRRTQATIGDIKKAINNRKKSGRIRDGQPTAEEDFAPFIAERHTESTQEPTQDKIDKYKQYNAKANIEALRGLIEYNAKTPPVSTGFPALDEVFDGGLYEGLYVIGAMSSLGKTTFIQQMADQIAQQGHDILFISLEMSRTDLMSKSISRETFLHTKQYKLDESNAKTSRGILDGSRYYKDDERGIRGYNMQEKETIEAGIERYSEYAGNIYIVEGGNGVTYENVQAKVKEHEKATGKTPVVIVDYLQLLEPTDVRATDKKNTDDAVKGLKKIVHDHHTPIFAISSVARNKYDQPLGMDAYKESGAIEYTSEVLLVLDFKEMVVDSKSCNVNFEKKKTPRDVTITILKNRTGQTGHRVDYKYYPAYNMFDEVGKFSPISSAESDFKENIVSKW
ncbi:DnaB-like helicase C-terminal domain-containing protein [Staphylococcus shinii]|uniref:DnaB-like helicase C-terminal domain-containing protein n=1 Tax=Staphylococcus shinii TaxID=2912228 RepID=UPI003D8082C5